MPGGTEIEALKALASHSQSWADWSTLLVVVGLIGEIVIAFAYTKDKPISEIVLGVLCGVIIALGVFGEYRFGSKAADTNAQLRGVSDRKIAELNDDAKQAGLAQKKIEQENIKLQIMLDELRREVGPRFLSLEQKKGLVEALSRFDPDSVTVSCQQGDFEAARFVDDFMGVFKKAGWKHFGRGWISPIYATFMAYGKLMGIPPPGMTIRVNDPSHPPPAAKALLVTLQKEGFDVRLVSSKDLLITSDRPTQFALLIGPKAGGNP